MIPIQDLPELEIQRKLFSFFNDPSKKFKTTSGIDLQILSLGSLNRESGPDFLNAAILTNNKIVIGDIEFDKKSSNWFHHQHHFNPEFANVLLQIVFQNDKNLHIPQLIIKPEDLTLTNKKPSYDADNIEDLQSFALKRLLRKSSDAKILIQRNGIQKGFYLLCKEFLKRLSDKVKRPFKKNIFKAILESINDSELLIFLRKIDEGLCFDLGYKIHLLSEIKIGKEGKGLRREILLNCLIPAALSIANEFQRAELLRWYWSEPASHSYALIRKRFPDISQNYLWQQQGVLEYLNNFEVRLVKERSFVYSISEIIEFLDSIKMK